MPLLSFVGRAERPAYSSDWGEVMSPRNGRRGAANQRKLFIARDITTGIRRFARRWGNFLPIRGRSPLFCGNFSFFSGNEAANSPSGTAPALPTAFNSREGTSAPAARPIRKARPSPQRVPSGRHVRTRNASHPEGTSAPTARPLPESVRRPAKEALQEFTLILYFHSVVEIVTIKWRVTFPESSWLRNRAPLRSR